jgi:putative protease
MKSNSIDTPELLAPVQDWKTLKFIETIPDSIYFGLENFNMRRNAQNFKENDLGKIVEYCHSQEPPSKAYLCTNILIYNSELEELKRVIRKAKEAEIDAIIAHDIAAIEYAREFDINFHISTQANISNIMSAQYYENLGAERLILARELSIDQIKEIKQSLKTCQIECFVHGSMCTSISGRCYFSAIVEDSSEYSANRGKCMQPCRREWTVKDDQNNEFIYNGEMFLNAKDLCMIEHIPELIEANIDAFKIEGRMKDPLYVKTVCQCYREAIDSYYTNTFTQNKIDGWLKRLSKVYNRSFHTGFYFQIPTPEEIQLETRGNTSKWKRAYIGKILSYNSNTKTANILIENQNLSIEEGERIFIENEQILLEDVLKKIFISGEKVKSIQLGKSSSSIQINASLQSKPQSGDRIFKITRTPKIL